MKEQMNPIYVIGHRNPDTDSICSAIGYAHLKKEMGEHAIPARAGKINAETKFVLEYFGLEKPELIQDLYPRVKEVMTEDVITIKPDDTLRELGSLMHRYSVKSVPVVDERKGVVGVVSVGDLAKRYFEEIEMQDLSQSGVDFSGLLRVLDGILLAGAENLHHKITGRLRIAAGSNETIEKFVKPGDVTLVSDRPNAQMACLQCKVACMIITGGALVTEEVLVAARKQGTVIIRAEHDTYTCARYVNQSIPVSLVMKNKVTAFKSTDLLSDVRTIMADTNFRVYPVVENGKMIGAIIRDKLIIQERTKIILVDHNERSQAVEGIEDAQIVEIIDHHRLGGLQTSDPIFIRHEPVGCTATIVSNMHWHRGIHIPPKIAGVLLSAIISDTVLFKSPTCTAKDRETAEKLADIAGLNIKEYGMQLLKAGASVKGMSAADIVGNDAKEFQIGNYRMVIAQLSVMDASEVLDMKTDLQEAMKRVCTKEGYDMALLLITNILEEGTHLIHVGQPTELLVKAFGESCESGDCYLPGVMSRKKQVVPPLAEAVRL
ncbi:putative manganese-dependent inorganic diphosphatase [Azotosporobacter soli]|uniref:putative manganese-dependent inorganic diphosphatase n=1 Tax=Azotosporobacter soli TaxID=3055040 RepID=UPI0031FE5549